MIRTGLHLHFDCASGVAGDMTLAALLHLGVPEEVVTGALDSLGVPGLTIEVAAVERAHLAALHVTGPDEGDDEPSRTWRDIRELLERGKLEPAVRELALSVFERLARAEAAVHGTDVDHVHFHEVGGLDAIADIVGIAAAIHHLAPSGFSTTTLPLGGGTVKTRHGVLPVPAPATLKLLEGAPVALGDATDGELVTPTGAAVIATLMTPFVAPPSLRVVGHGYGAGTRQIPGRANVLRVILGEPLQAADPPSAGWVEALANIDDMSPELGAWAVERLISEGAADAWQEPLVMKKGRAGVKVGFLCREPDLERLAHCLLAESSTIGVRYHRVRRVESTRRVVPVTTPYGEIRIKVSEAAGAPPNVAPEYEDCRRAAEREGVPLKEVYRVALRAYGAEEEPR